MIDPSPSQEPIDATENDGVERDFSLGAVVFGILVGVLAGLLRPRSWKS